MSGHQSSEQTPSGRVPTRILVLSDTHSALPDPLRRPDLRFSHKFPEADVAIHCGDLTSCGKDYEHRNAVALLKALPAPIKIVIPGNHDMTLDPIYLQRNRRLHGWTRPHRPDDFNDAVNLYTNREAKEAGIRYIVEGLHSFILPNGAKLTIYASAFTPEFCNWGFAYPRSYDRFNITGERTPDNPVPHFTPWKVDTESMNDQATVMVTHGPPRGILDKTTHGESVGCDHLMTAVSHCRPLLHCFGHIHEAWGAETRLWPSKAENGGAIGSEAAELRRPSDQNGTTRQGNGTTNSRGQPSTEDMGYQVIGGGEHHDFRIAPGEPRITISHPMDPRDTLTPDMQEELKAVSVVDATAAEHGKETVFINASIMDVRYVPSQWPWLVRLELPGASKEEMEYS